MTESVYRYMRMKKKMVKKMVHKKRRPARRTVKVIAFWTGTRRGSQPQGPEASLAKLKYTVEELETKIDYGCSMDLIIVNSINAHEDDRFVINYLNNLNGKETRNGKITVLHKKNEGISFGAFSYAFNLFKDHYDYWFFSEDDYLTVASNSMSIAISMMEADPCLGFVASVEKVGRGLGTYYARGGSGISSTDILKRTWPNGLPFFGGDERHMRRHEKYEKKFTRAILDNHTPQLTMEILPTRSLMVWNKAFHGDRSTPQKMKDGRTKVFMDSFRVKSVSAPDPETLLQS